MLSRLLSIALCLLFLPLAQGVRAAPDLSSRNTLSTGAMSPGVVATGGPWAASAYKPVFHNNNYFAWQLTEVMVTGPWDGTPAQAHFIAPELPENEIYGTALGLEGNRLAVGAPSGGVWRWSCDEYYCYEVWSMRDPGKVYLYQYDGSAFELEQTLSRGDAQGRFGHALALAQGQLLVGSPGAVPGKAYLFDAATGVESAMLVSPTPEADDDFGSVVALNDTLAVIGAPQSNTVYVYENGVAGWTLLASLTHPDPAAAFGASLAVDNGRILIGAFGISAAFLYDRADVAAGATLPVQYADWLPAAQFAGAADTDFGYAVALLDDALWISAPRELVDGFLHGTVRQYETSAGSGWTLADTLHSAVPAIADDFGKAMAVSPERFTVTSTEQGLQDVFTAVDKVYDPDGDGVAAIADNCPDTANPSQGDVDQDGTGDACDDDIDGDTLSNAAEEAAGTDPYNPDTDGDGLRDDKDPVPLHRDIDADGLEDPVDNCPTVANPAQENVDGDKYGDACDDDIDADTLSNEDEIAAGTDPYKRDTDGDGQRDDYDLFPIDAHDGWSHVYRFPLIDPNYVAIRGDLALGANSANILQAYARVNGDWEQIAAPDLAALNAGQIMGVALSGTTAAIVVQTSQINQPGQFRPSVLIYRWNAQTGWGYVQGFSPPFYRYYVDEIRLDGNLLVIVGRPEVFGSGFRGLVEIYKLQGGLYQYTGNYSTDEWSYVLEAQISGDKVFVGDHIIYSGNPPVLHRLSATGVIEASVLTSIKDSTQSSSCINPSNSPLISAGNGKALVSTDGPDYWVEKPQSSNVLALTPVPFGNNNIAGLGDTNLVGLEHPVPLTHPVTGAQADFNLKVLSMEDGRSLGVIPNRRGNSACWVRWSTDGLAVAVATSDGYVEIYPIDRDGDGIVDGSDNCRNVANPDQADADGDGIGDVCEPVGPGC